jgi:anti-anti-sigma factor
LIPDHLSTAASRLRITVDETGDRVRLTLAGELDSDEAATFAVAVARAALRHPGRPIGIDAAAVDFLDSGGIRALIESRHLAESAGCHLTVTDVSVIVHQVLDISGLLTIFEVPQRRQGPGAP